jgi:hypothetical protein
MPRLDLTEQEVRRLEQKLRGSPEYGPDNLLYQIWRKAADACNKLDDVEYRRLYGVGLPRSLWK